MLNLFFHCGSGGQAQVVRLSVARDYLMEIYFQPDSQVLCCSKTGAPHPVNFTFGVSGITGLCIFTTLD